MTTGRITHTTSHVQTIQQKVNQHNTQYTYYLNPVQVVQHNLATYGYKGTINVISPSPQPTPTPYTNQSGFPQVKVLVQYNGQKYAVFLDQPVQKGPSGIWIIIAIWSCATTNYCQ